MPLRPGVLAAIAAVLVSSVDPIAQDPVAQDPGRPDHGLAAVCARGRLDAAFLAACRATVAAEVAAHALGRALPAGFFEPLDDDAVLAIAVHGPKVASNLALLRAHDPAAVTRYDQLAIAFAAAWASGDDAEPRRFWVDDWLVRGREIPSMTASFDDWVGRSRRLRLPLRDVPWPVLAHLADSVTPLAERRWAVEQYGERDTAGLRDLFGAVPYTLDPRRGETPCTLASFLAIGGPCTHNVQFATGVFDAFGIPSGWAGGPGHTFPYWFERDGRELVLRDTNDLGCDNGRIRDPMGPRQVWQDELRLLVAALNASAERRTRAALAAWAFGRVPADERAAATPILVAAVRANPFCGELLDAVAEATAAGQLALADGAPVWRTLGATLVDWPRALVPRLERALPPRGATAPTFDGDLALLDDLERRWSKAKLSSPLANLPGWRARCLAARGRTAEANRLWRAVAKTAAATDPERFAAAADTLAALVGESPSAARAELFEALLELAEPKPRAGWSEVHRSRFAAVRRLVAELRALGRGADADRRWYEELLAAREESVAIVGGSGGDPFEDVPAGAELIGLRVATTGYQGRSVIGCVAGIYRVDGRDVAGARFGNERAGAVELRAPAGWRVAGIVAAGSDRLDGLQLCCVPDDPKDERVAFGEWLGSHREREVLLGGREVRVVGIRGRAGADVDGLGVAVAGGRR